MNGRNPGSSKKAAPRLKARISRAVALERRIAGGLATPNETQEYRRILNVFRDKFRNGSLSPENAHLLGIDN